MTDREAAFTEDLADLAGATHFGILALWYYSDTPDWPPTEPRPVMPCFGDEVFERVIPVGYA